MFLGHTDKLVINKMRSMTCITKVSLLGLIVLGFFSIDCYAQLKVDGNGHVGINSSSSTFDSYLSVGGTGSDQYPVHVVGIKNGLYSGRTSSSTYGSPAWGFGLWGNADSKSVYYSVGVEATSWTPDNTSSRYGYSYGVLARAGSGSAGRSYAVFGNLMYNHTGAAIYGTITNNSNGDYINGSYSAYLVGNVKISGNVETANGTYLSNAVPTESFDGSNVEKLSEQNEKTVSRLANLDAVSYYERNEQINEEDSLVSEKLTSAQKAYLAKQHYGVPLNQLEEYYPELVYEKEDGSKGVNYTEMIPLLLQSIKELNAEIEELKRQLKGK